MNVLSILENKKVRTFAVGLAAGLALPLIVNSKTTRKVAVSGVAKGLKIKEDAQAALESIKEDAQDVYAEAKQQRTAGSAEA
ncbi:MAG: DUF6110 family protein [Peptococcaceae bacterium]|jgi:hypothetical protein|nr:DUF6110 family protein [Peptococcaceae bacterium]